jgi:uncharacterized protein (TIGR03118 family)
MASVVLCVSSFVSAQSYKKTNLVSNISGIAPVTDVTLVNPWGIAHTQNGEWCVANNKTGIVTVYDGTGKKEPLIINIPSSTGNNGPVTGIVYNGTSDFEIDSGKPAVFIFVTEDGTISGWNPDIYPRPQMRYYALLKANNGTDGVYKGVAIILNMEGNFLCIANFKGGTVDVFDTNFNQVSLNKGVFVDKKIPDSFAPFNIQNIQGKVYVAYAKQNADKKDAVEDLGPE